MWTQFAVAKTAMGARNIGQAPAHTAMPRVTTTSPRYMGLRVKRYGPMVISLRLAGEVGLTSVPSRRNMMIAQTGRIQGNGYQGDAERRKREAGHFGPAERPANRHGEENID